MAPYKAKQFVLLLLFKSKSVFRPPSTPEKPMKARLRRPAKSITMTVEKA